MEIINVIVVISGILHDVVSFVRMDTNDSLPVEEAENEFADQIRKVSPSIGDDEIDAALDNGYWTDNNKHDIWMRWSYPTNMQSL